MGFLDNLLKVNSILITLGFGSIITIVSNMSKATKKSREKTEQRFKNLEYANIAILHNDLYKQCSEFLEQGWISIDDLENLEYLWRGYSDLGGNGTGEVLYKKVQELPNIKPKGVN